MSAWLCVVGLAGCDGAFRVRHDAVDYGGQRLGVFRAHDEVAATDQETRHALDAELACHGVLLRHGFNVGIRVQEFLDKFAVHANHVGNFSEDFRVSDVAAFAEVGLEQTLDNFVLDAERVRPADEAVRVQRVRRARDAVEGERDAFCLACGFNRDLICFSFSSEPNLLTRCALRS